MTNAPLTIRLRRPLLGLALLSTATIVSTAAGCAMEPEAQDSGSAAVVTPAVDPSAPAPLRRVCPSRRNADGSWVVVDGLDISDWKYTDWDRVVQENPKFKYAFTRVGAGLVHQDNRLFIDWPAIKRVGLIRGVYQYFKPSQSAIAQSDLFIARMAQEGGFEPEDFPPVLDFETTNDMPTPTVLCRVKIWLARVERATKRLPIIYTSNQLNALFPGEFRRYPLWIPNYVGIPPTRCPETPDIWERWKLWQYAEDGVVRGVFENSDINDPNGGSPAMDGGVQVQGRVDVNYFDGTLSDLRGFIASTGSTGDVADPPPLANPPVVRGAGPVGSPIDCADGCCTAAP